MHKHLTSGDRHEIYALYKQGFSRIDIANSIGVDVSTIGRELTRNSGQRGYRPIQAHNKAVNRRSSANSHIRLTDELKKIIIEYLKQEWSPQQISSYLRAHHKDWVSHETIYKFIYEDKKNGGKLYKYLRRGKKKYKNRKTGSDKRGQIKDRISIDQRPAIVDRRKRLGDWEVDLVIGKNHKGALVTIVERLSRKTLIVKVVSKHADVVAAAIIKALLKYKGLAASSITADNGKEFADHKKISETLCLDFYFAHPYSSWERGTNENTNGLIRQYFPKGSDFSEIDDKACQFVMDRLNNRPRKCLNYKTPNQVFDELLKAA